jgi:hypothetical protein
MVGGQLIKDAVHKALFGLPWLGSRPFVQGENQVPFCLTLLQDKLRGPVVDEVGSGVSHLGFGSRIGPT